MLAFGMLATVDPHDQLQVGAAEVSDVVAYGMLPPEAGTGELSPAQMPP